MIRTCQQCGRELPLDAHGNQKLCDECRVAQWITRRRLEARVFYRRHRDQVLAKAKAERRGEKLT